ncbi:MAG: hypothetical protein F6K47_42500 [Symploca sp. SIO2E6]|nr:hypothetical protein [Symploca sp. SIO2E6]
MQNPLPATPPPSPENNCPDCLYLDLSGEIIESQKNFLSKLKRQSKETEKIELYVTINFNEQWENLPGGRVKFGLRGGELRLNLEGANIPYKYRQFNDPLELPVDKERQQQEGREHQHGLEASWARGKH